LSLLGREEARGLCGLFFDLDDTFLSSGTLMRAAYDALWSLRDAGLRVVPVTGRPSAWGAVLAKQWPVDGVIVENGAVWFRRNGAHVVRTDACEANERERRRAGLAQLIDRVRRVVPDACLTEDVELRRSDVTWDVGETVTLPEERIASVVAEIEAAGARWSRSSVHLHATFDVDDKATGALRFCARELGVDAGFAVVRFAFAGDSGNDAPCFAAFRTTFAVANVQSSLVRLSVVPRYVAPRAMGAGFADIAAEILKKR
jgi:HAD superfamily hydrolase (TIGR01484 family)